MNLEEYISSGILEAYVMNELSMEERAEVEKAISEHSEIKAEVEAIELSMENLAFMTAITPPKEVKDKLMSQVDSEQITQQKKTEVVSMQSGDGSGSFLKLAAAASIIIALVSIFMAFNYWKKWQSAEGRLSELISQNQQFAENYDQVNQQLEGIQNAVAIMNSSSYRRIVMNGTENSPGALATVYWNKTTEEVYLNIQNLKDLSKEQQYQLWAIIDGKPVDAGVFNTNSDTFLVQMKNTGSDVAAFAVTIEPYGGSESPSLKTMQVVGNV